MNRIGVIGAMKEEIEHLIGEMDITEKVLKAGITFYTGTFANQNIVLCQCGVGKVNAAVCTQLLVDQFGVDQIIFTGVAGALDPKLKIGDIVISTYCIQHDMDASPLGFKQGEIPFAKQSIFAADVRLVELASDISEKLFPGQTVKGKVLSGDQFVADRAKVKQLYELMGGACVEMEGAAVAQVCYMNDIPFVIIRSMSDQADGEASINFAEFTEKAAYHSYQIVTNMIRSL